MFSSQIYCVTFVNHRCTGGFTYFTLHFIHATFCIEPRNTLDWKFIASVKECIEKNMGDLDFGVDVLSNQHHMSRTSFYNKLKALTGYAPADYIRMIRLQRAAQLLKQKEYTITEIAEIVGFSDAKYFREVFKKYYNVSPSKFVNSDQE